MRTIHYGVRFAIVLFLVAVFYWGAAAILRETAQPVTLLTLLFMAVCAELLEALLRWAAPVIGAVDMKEQEKAQVRLVEHQLACALRYGTPLVVAAIRGKHRISLHVAARILRKTDIVVRHSSGWLLVLMPFTTIEQSVSAFKRVASQLPLKDIVVTDMAMLQSSLKMQRVGTDEKVNSFSSRELRKICLQAFERKLVSVSTQAEEMQAPVMYSLFAPEALDIPFIPAETSIYSQSASEFLSKVGEDAAKVATL